MADDALWAKMQRTMDFILEQQANTAVRHAEFEDYTRHAVERHDREMAAIRDRLKRAVEFGVREARNERKRRQELDARINAKFEALMDSLPRGGNGHS